MAVHGPQRLPQRLHFGPHFFELHTHVDPGRFDLAGLAFHPQFDMAPRLGIAHARQAEHAHAGIASFQRFHQRREHGFRLLV
ncbi:conserved hypothetical protein, partial [Ricinus communis]